jgi:hypothetical protein
MANDVRIEHFGSFRYVGHFDLRQFVVFYAVNWKDLKTCMDSALANSTLTLWVSCGVSSKSVN